MATPKHTHRRAAERIQPAHRQTGTPASDPERLIQAACIIKACIVTNDTSHSMDFDLSYPLEAAHSLIREVIARRKDRKRSLAKLRRPAAPPSSIFEQLQQAATIVSVCILANDVSPNMYEAVDFSHPMHAAVSLLDEVVARMDTEGDKEFERRNPKLMRDVEIMSTRPNVVAEGKPN